MRDNQIEFSNGCIVSKATDSHLPVYGGLLDVIDNRPNCSQGPDRPTYLVKSKKCAINYANGFPFEDNYAFRSK